MTRFSVKLKNILGSAYYRYEIGTSANNFTKGETCTVTVTVKDIFGNAVQNKDIVLYNSGTSEGTETTDSNGQAQWTLTMNSIGLRKLTVSNKYAYVWVVGYTTTVWSDSYGKWTASFGTGVCNVSYERSSITITASGTYTIRDAFASGSTNLKYCPPKLMYFKCNNKNVTVDISDEGRIRLINDTSTAISNATIRFNVSFIVKGYIS